MEYCTYQLLTIEIFMCAIFNMSQLKGLNNILQSKGMLQATLVLSMMILCSKSQDAFPVARRPPNAEKALSLQSQLSGRPRETSGGPLSSHPPQPPDLLFAPCQSSTATEESIQLSSTILAQADSEDAAVPVPPTYNKRARRPPLVRNFNLPMFYPVQPREMTRYYASALTHDEKTALAEGQKNHNQKSWTAKDLILHREALKDLKPTIVYTGSDEQVCIIPVIIVTDGKNARTHKQQVYHKAP